MNRKNAGKKSSSKDQDKQQALRSSLVESDSDNAKRDNKVSPSKSQAKTKKTEKSGLAAR